MTTSNLISLVLDLVGIVTVLIYSYKLHKTTKELEVLLEQYSQLITSQGEFIKTIDPLYFYCMQKLIEEAVEREDYEKASELKTHLEQALKLYVKNNE